MAVANFCGPNFRNKSEWHSQHTRLWSNTLKILRGMSNITQERHLLSICLHQIKKATWEIPILQFTSFATLYHDSKLPMHAHSLHDIFQEGTISCSASHHACLSHFPNDNLNPWLTLLCSSIKELFVGFQCALRNNYVFSFCLADTGYMISLWMSGNNGQ